MNTLKILFTPLNYLRIKHSSKKWFDYIYPISISLIIYLIFTFSPLSINLIGDKGLIPGINGLLQILIGFYIAALAAVSTFGGAHIDKELSGEKATLKVSRAGEDKTIVLTRRKFISYLFGFLSFTSIVLYFLGLISTLLAVPLETYLSSFSKFSFYNVIQDTFILIYSFIFASLMVNTLLGLHYLTDRIHR